MLVVVGAPLLDHAVFVLGWETIAMTMSTTNDVPLLLEAAFLPLLLFAFTSTTTLHSCHNQ